MTLRIHYVGGLPTTTYLTLAEQIQEMEAVEIILHEVTPDSALDLVELMKEALMWLSENHDSGWLPINMPTDTPRRGKGEKRRNRATRWR